MTVRLLLADDHAVVRQGLRALLQTAEDLQVVAAGGSYLQPEVTGTLLREVRAARQASGGAKILTQREREVLSELAQGRSNAQIAHRLGIAEKTVKTHVSSILGKMGLADRTQAALYAVKHGLAEPP